VSKEGVVQTKTWCQYTKKLLYELELEKYWRESKALDEKTWSTIVKEKIQAREQKRWLERMKEKPKLRTYITLKKELKQEMYLTVRDRCGVPEFTRLRGGTNRLKIEKGRFEKLAPEDRICEFCGTGEVENEFHFMMICPLYREFRKELWLSVKRDLPQPVMIYADEDKFFIFMTAQESEVVKKVLKFIKQAMRARREIESHREKEAEEKAKKRKREPLP